VAVVDVSNPTAPAVLQWIHLRGLAVAVAVSSDLLVVGLSGRRVRVYRLASGTAPALLAQLLLDHQPVAIRATAGLVHVAEAGPVGWAACAAGIACGPGRQVEVFRLDGQAGALSLEAVYGGASDPWQRALWARSAGARVLVPDLLGLRRYRAEVTP
jgi:hypothetical protein